MFKLNNKEDYINKFESNEGEYENYSDETYVTELDKTFSKGEEFNILQQTPHKNEITCDFKLSYLLWASLQLVNCFRSLNTYITSNKSHTGEVIDSLISILKFFPYVSSIQQQEWVRKIELVCESEGRFIQIFIFELFINLQTYLVIYQMLNTSEKDVIYTWVLFEYIMSTNDSEIIKKIYKRLRDDLNISSIKRFRDSLISGKPN